MGSPVQQIEVVIVFEGRSVEHFDRGLADFPAFGAFFIDSAGPLESGLCENLSAVEWAGSFAAELEDVVVFEAVDRALFFLSGGICHDNFEIQVAH